MGLLKKFTRKLRREPMRKRNETPPDAARRDCALNIYSSNAFENEISEQSGFGFFKLPLEIREMIYAELIPFERVWIMLANKQLVCDWESTHTPARVDPLLPPSTQISTKSKPIWGLGILSFLQTCRRVYFEAIPYLYCNPTFAFHDTLPFLTFVASIPPSHSNLIRSVIINFAYEDASPVLPHYLRRRHERAQSFTIKRPEACSLDYTFLHDGSYAGRLYNASILLRQNSNPLLPSFMWDAIANALKEMKGLQKVHITLLNIQRRIEVWVEHGYEHSGQRDAADIKRSLEWVARDRPWKGEKGDEDRKRRTRETEVIFENVWWKTSREHKIKGHWVREVSDDGEIEWREVGEAAGSIVRMY